nr:START domain-containing protein 10 isoform X3 [Globicephala melas]
MLGLKASVNTKERLRKRSASGWTRGGALAKVPGRWRQHLQPRRRCWSFRGGPRRAGLGPGLWASPMEKSAASTEPQGPRPVLGRDSVQVPDDQDFRSFRSECEAEAGWNLTYSKAGVSVWVQAVEMDRTLHKIKKYPPRKDLVRAVSIQTGYLIQSTGPKSCVITYMAQVDPKGSLPKWVVNKSSQFLAPKAMKKMYKACVKYPEWKQKHQPHFKPWLHPEQSPLPSLALSELSVQHADSLENIDESAVAESREERVGSAGGEGSDDDTSLT